MSHFFCIFLLFLFIYLYTIYKVYRYVHILISGLVGGLVAQPPLGPNGRALNQPKLHPSNRTV